MNLSVGFGAVNGSTLFFSVFTVACLFYSYKIPQKTLSWALGLLGNCFFGPLLFLNGLILLISPNPFTVLLITCLILHIFFIYSKYKHQGPFNWLLVGLGIPAFYSKPDEILKFKTGLAHFYKAADPEAPCVVMIFGGGFIGGSPGQLASLPHFLKRNGYHVVCLPYRHLPDGIWPFPLADLTDGLQELLQTSNSQFKPTAFHLMGRSAGGYLAMQLSYAFRNEERLKSVLALYPICDLMAWSEEKGAQSILAAKQIVQRLLVNDQPTYTDLRQMPQPLFRDFLLVTGDFDPYVEHRHSEWLNESLVSSGNRVELMVLPLQSHGFDVSLNSFAGQILGRKLLSFFARKKNEN